MYGRESESVCVGGMEGVCALERERECVTARECEF